MVEIPRRRQHHRITSAGQRHHGECKSQIAAGGDGDIGGADPRFIGARHIGGEGLSQSAFAFNRAIAGGFGIPRRGGQSREQFRMRRIAWHGLGQIEHRPSAPLVAGGPAAHGGNGRGAGGADAGGKRQIHQRKEPSPRGGVHGAIGFARGLVPALRFLERPAQLGDAAPGLSLGAELPPLICQNAQMHGGFRAESGEAARKFGAILGRIGNQPRRGLLCQGGGRQKQQKGKDPGHASFISCAALPGRFGLMKPASCAGTEHEPRLQPWPFRAGPGIP